MIVKFPSSFGARDETTAGGPGELVPGAVRRGCAVELLDVDRKACLAQAHDLGAVSLEANPEIGARVTAERADQQRDQHGSDRRKHAARDTDESLAPLLLGQNVLQDGVIAATSTASPGEHVPHCT